MQDKSNIMKKTAVFPGTFDPFTRGHENILNRALPLFDHIIIAIGVHSHKQTLFSREQRIEMIRKMYRNEPMITVDSYDGLTIDYCVKAGAQYLLRGLRTAADFEYERAIAQINRKMNPSIETVFLLAIPEYTPLNSTIIRDILRHGGDARQFLPEGLELD